ncbi:MAG: tetratricopeptide repeat protein [Candidatus Omnitrophica bacterium]|nr:tetratricopeptide repeat protein [Candidatus Omnitrophota bacterium]MBU4468293.1 tetratricopeptide repeat protein [Candidatus Omnitrophota bacterium]MCG2707958.1 tetratricopeptide repeat protein [Candidatus Omnitrophota bacterium]
MDRKLINGSMNDEQIKEVIKNVAKDSVFAKIHLDEILQVLDKYKGTKVIDSATELEKELSQKSALVKAMFFYLQGLYDDAWEILSVFSEDLDYEICFLKGMVLAEKKEYEIARKHFMNALKFVNTDKARAHFDLGICWYQESSYEKAIQEFDEAIGVKKDYLVAYNSKALALKRLGKVNEAIKELQKIIDIDKKNDKAYYNLACYYSILKNPEAALKNLAISFDLNSVRKDKSGEDPDFINIKELPEFKKLIVNKG